MSSSFSDVWMVDKAFWGKAALKELSNADRNWIGGVVLKGRPRKSILECIGKGGGGGGINF